ncbi:MULTISPECIES: hypothetical protein [Bacillus cereus group]|uniref:Uncharacterized protein n=1 Tax=Bacillus cereus (strain AH187) TaxID=405534 RepID=B7HUA8_BACC7|nr:MULTISPECIES: hypothetical protein [Bacillus cereus group]ACJ79816.1 hypothetical protein BCAH187_A0650 [Bacillus cereus AH187]SME06355.1 hypothetical protein BACERE00183_01338 [Bacillus cereus]MBR9742069.1 hypothetical protein [Bacillus paranthracis]MDA1824009.1 hypothetical protein [Bacillus cereus group sp. BY2-1LC]MDX5778694.1 hypothetical protein [Bacillus cereus group sp. DSM 4312]
MKILRDVKIVLDEKNGNRKTTDVTLISKELHNGTFFSIVNGSGKEITAEHSTIEEALQQLSLSYKII